KLERFSALHGEHRGALFHPVGWEDTIAGVGRPQALINEDLKQCDYAVFVVHDRWGTPTGGGYTSGTEEEWALAEELYEANKIRNVALFLALREQVAKALVNKGVTPARSGAATKRLRSMTMSWRGSEPRPSWRCANWSPRRSSTKGQGSARSGAATK